MVQSNTDSSQGGSLGDLMGNVLSAGSDQPVASQNDQDQLSDEPKSPEPEQSKPPEPETEPQQSKSPESKTLTEKPTPTPGATKTEQPATTPNPPKTETTQPKPAATQQSKTTTAHTQSTANTQPKETSGPSKSSAIVQTTHTTQISITMAPTTNTPTTVKPSTTNAFSTTSQASSITLIPTLSITVSETSTPTSSSTPSANNGGAIAGAIVGSLLGAFIIVAAIFLLIRKRKQRAQSTRVSRTMDNIFALDQREQGYEEKTADHYVSSPNMAQHYTTNSGQIPYSHQHPDQAFSTAMSPAMMYASPSLNQLQRQATFVSHGNASEVMVDTYMQDPYMQDPYNHHVYHPGNGYYQPELYSEDIYAPQAPHTPEQNYRPLQHESRSTSGSVTGGNNNSHSN